MKNRQWMDMDKKISVESAWLGWFFIVSCRLSVCHFPLEESS